MAAVDPRAVAVTIRGPVERADLAGLCARVCRALRGNPGRALVCTMDAAVRADLVALEALAQLRLASQRLGCPVRLRAADSAIVQLVALAGLSDVLACELTSAGNRQPSPPSRPN